uniref:Uncharacterized protein n=1 Tax=Helianthus annuus TaxID=4232 RepID=A0A251T9V7_HELAN
MRGFHCKAFPFNHKSFLGRLKGCYLFFSGKLHSALTNYNCHSEHTLPWPSYDDIIVGRDIDHRKSELFGSSLCSFAEQTLGVIWPKGLVGMSAIPSMEDSGC